MSYTLLPEWTELDAVILAWPDQKTDWRSNLEEARKTYLSLIQSINHCGVSVILLIREQEIEECKLLLSGDERVLFVCAQYNDTWTRDYAFLTLSNGCETKAVEFTFNGWGKKFEADLDNRINQTVLAPLLRSKIDTIPLVCEGGALEIDESGHLLSTQFCLSNPLRNESGDPDAYTECFTNTLGAIKTTVFQNGHLQGDDTDAHIDTLVRFFPAAGVVVQSCFNRKDDSHYEGLSALVDEVKQALPEDKLFELPLPEVFSNEGERLPASYANFLVCNNAVLYPIYDAEEDALALETMGRAFPGYQIKAVNCLPLVQQYGSLHCVTMQVPKGILKPEVVAQFERGVSIYE